MTALTVFEELERAFRDRIAEMRGLVVLRENSAASATEAERERWQEDLQQIAERVHDVEKLADALAQDVDEELRQLEQARDTWRTAFAEQKRELEALVDALPVGMRPTSDSRARTSRTQSSSEASGTSGAGARPSGEASASQSESTCGATVSGSGSASGATATATATESASTRPPPNKKKRVQSGESSRRSVRSSVSAASTTNAAAVSAGTNGSSSSRKTAALGGAQRPKRVTKSELEKVPKYMRGRLTADKCNEALDELARLIDERARLLQLPASAAARLRPPQSDQYERFRAMQLAARESKTPVPRRFVSEHDFVDSPTLRLDNTGKMLFSTLRHLGAVREFLCANQKCFTLL